MLEKRIYRQILGHLEKMGILAKVDGAQLGRYATLYVRWHEMRQAVQHLGDTYQTEDSLGNMVWKVRPEAKLFVTYHAELARIEACFGLTPSARASIGMQTSIGDAAKKASEGEPAGKARFFA
jgi:P27 family predicted phage terminase small subunit